MALSYYYFTCSPLSNLSGNLYSIYQWIICLLFHTDLDLLRSMSLFHKIWVCTFVSNKCNSARWLMHHYHIFSISRFNQVRRNVFYCLRQVLDFNLQSFQECSKSDLVSADRFLILNEMSSQIRDFFKDNQFSKAISTLKAFTSTYQAKVCDSS